MKIRYSKKVRALGWGIIIFEILALFLWVAAIYGEGATAASIITSNLISTNGPKSIVQNTSSGEVIALPIKGAGILPVSTTISVDASYLNSQNQTVAQVSDSVTVSLGETKNLTLTVPENLVSSTGTLAGYHVYAVFEISTLGGLVGTKLEAAAYPSSGGTSA